MSNNDRYAPQRNSKIPVTGRQFVWLQDDDKGEVMLHVGPTMVAPRAAEKVVIDDGQGLYITAQRPEPQRMIELNEMQYAVLTNPLADRRPEEGPNGNFKDGRNSPRPLRFGMRHMIAGPCSFHLWPGQRLEVRDAYELSSNQYLVVKVYGDVDADSPWYDITARSAAIVTATTDALDALDLPSDLPPLTRGQLIVIRGLDTHFYIPPTGIDVVADLTVGDDGSVMSAQQAQRLLNKAPSREAAAAAAMTGTESAPPGMGPPQPPIAQGLESIGGLQSKVAVGKGGGGRRKDVSYDSPAQEANEHAEFYANAEDAFGYAGDELSLDDDAPEYDESEEEYERRPSPADARRGQKADKLSKEYASRSVQSRDSMEREYKKKRSGPPPMEPPAPPPSLPPPPPKRAPSALEQSVQRTSAPLPQNFGSGGPPAPPPASATVYPSAPYPVSPPPGYPNAAPAPAPMPPAKPSARPIQAKNEEARVEAPRPQAPSKMPFSAPTPEPEPVVEALAKQKAQSLGEQQLAALSDNDIQQLTASDMHRKALERQVRMARLVRQAVALGEKDFCVLIDADGRRQIKVGPARIFPGPYDRFLTAGSRNRIYNAFEMLPQRALWLRFVAEIQRSKLHKLLPQSIKLSQETYNPGDDILITGVNTFFFPFDEAEVLNPATGQPHIGNDHESVFIHAIGIDQRSGIYVQDLSSGEVRLIKGQRTYLVDPRREKRITRTIPAREWNLWVASTQPQRWTQHPVTTPWAVAVNVPNNAACMAVSSSERRLIEGPCISLLSHDERLVVLRAGLSEDAAATCFLRTRGDALTLSVDIQTSDFVTLNLGLRLHIDFDPALQDRWFDIENPGLHLFAFIQRITRDACRKLIALDLWSRAHGVLRDAILGDSTRNSPRVLPENGLRIIDVEVVDITFLDSQIADQLESARHGIVERELHDVIDQRRYKAEIHRHAIQRQRLLLQQALVRATADLQERLQTLTAQERIDAIQKQQAVAATAEATEAQIASIQQAAALERQEQASVTAMEHHRKTSRQVAALQELEHTESNQHRNALQEIDIALSDAAAEAAVAAARAVHPALIDALTGLGDRLLLADVAKHLSLTGLVSPDLMGRLRELFQDSQTASPASPPPAAAPSPKTK